MTPDTGLSVTGVLGAKAAFRKTDLSGVGRITEVLARPSQPESICCRDPRSSPLGQAFRNVRGDQNLEFLSLVSLHHEHDPRANPILRRPGPQSGEAIGQAYWGGLLLRNAAIDLLEGVS
jgi:hypothetical protein